MAQGIQDLLGFGPVKEWLADQLDFLVSLMAALSESDSRMETEEIEVSDDP
jgi:hypothetical protein